MGVSRALCPDSWPTVAVGACADREWEGELRQQSVALCRWCVLARGYLALLEWARHTGMMVSASAEWL